MKLPKDLTPYQMEGLTLRPLTREDVPRMLEMQEEMLAALPDRRWYFPSDPKEFQDVVDQEEGFGYFQGDRLCGFAELTPGSNREHHGYAEKLDMPIEGSFDFHDVMVRPAMRGKGMHTRFLALFAEMARENGGYGVFATVDPENEASWHNFEKAGYEHLLDQPAYDGRMRRYYLLRL